MRNSDGRRETRSAERDGAVVCKGRAGRLGRCWIVVSLAIRLEEEKSVVVVERLASDVSVCSVRARLILQGHVDGSHYADCDDTVFFSTTCVCISGCCGKEDGCSSCVSVKKNIYRAKEQTVCTICTGTRGKRGRSDVR